MNYLDIIPRILSAEQVSAAKAFIDNHQTFVISAHMSPDGDALGSALSMQHYLRAKGKKATIVFNDAPGENLSFVPREEGDILIFDNQNNNSIPSQKEEVIKAIDESDAMVCVDFNTPSRLGNMKDVFMNHQAPKLLLDHHLDPAVENFDIVVSEPSECAACEVIFRFIVEMGDEQLIDKQLATTLFCGIMTDTGWFIFNSDRPEIHLIMARLMQEGVNREQIIKDSHLTLERRIRVQGYLMSKNLKTDYNHHAAYFSLSQAEIKRFGHQKGDTEGVVNIPLDIDGINVSAFFREEKKVIKVSLRSKGEYPVNLIAEKFFNGGGHRNAAGGEFYGSLAQAEAIFVKVLPLFDKYL